MTEKNLEDYVGKTFQTKNDNDGCKMPFDKTKTWTVVERIEEGGPFSGRSSVIVEQEGEKYELKKDKTKEVKMLIEHNKTKEVEK